MPVQELTAEPEAEHVAEPEATQAPEVAEDVPEYHVEVTEPAAAVPEQAEETPAPVIVTEDVAEDIPEVCLLYLHLWLCCTHSLAAEDACKRTCGQAEVSLDPILFCDAPGQQPSWHSCCPDEGA